MAARSGSTGQSTVEFALVLPLFFALLALLLQVALVARDEVMVVHAARAAVREATVTADAARVEAAATRALAAVHARVVRRGPVGQPVEVDVVYLSKTDLPLVGALLPDLTLRAAAVMSVEK
jgi:Flp pilus assembly protein TadG